MPGRFEDIRNTYKRIQEQTVAMQQKREDDVKWETFRELLKKQLQRIEDRLPKPAVA